jgi:hypothetical protein
MNEETKRNRNEDKVRVQLCSVKPSAGAGGGSCTERKVSILNHLGVTRPPMRVLRFSGTCICWGCDHRILGQPGVSISTVL